LKGGFVAKSRCVLLGYGGPFDKLKAGRTATLRQAQCRQAHHRWFDKLTTGRLKKRKKIRRSEQDAELGKFSDKSCGFFGVDGLENLGVKLGEQRR
jgi:hypothetical protein